MGVGRDKRLQVKQLQRVAQIDDTGCGIACLAMLLRKEYSWTKRLIFAHEPKHNNFRTDITDLRKALSKVGHGLGRKTRLRGDDLNEQIGRRRAVVMMNKYCSRGELRWHWAVWDGFRLLDPWKYKRHQYVAYYLFKRQ